MKILFFMILFSSVSESVYSQRVALLNLNFKSPILYTDSLTVEQVNSGYFPVEEASIHTFLAN
ncbi:MAG: hypothetical protein ACM3H8_11590, partial [Sphingobacteriales bacterium]